MSALEPSEPRETCGECMWLDPCPSPRCEWGACCLWSLRGDPEQVRIDWRIASERACGEFEG